MGLKLVGRMGAVAALAVVSVLAGPAQARAQWANPSGSAASIPASALVQPQALNRMLQAKGTAKPLLFQVGSYMLYREAHIPGSQYAGPGAQEAGLSLLRKTVAKLNHSTPIVIYCGCCPWSHCPNIWPAYQVLHEMGFTHVKALYLADNFGTDWVNKGYPVERAQ